VTDASTYLVLDEQQAAGIAASLAALGGPQVGISVVGTGTLTADLSQLTTFVSSAEELFGAVQTLTLTAADVPDLAELGFWSQTALDITSGAEGAYQPDLGSLPAGEMVHTFATTVTAAQSTLMSGVETSWCDTPGYCPISAVAQPGQYIQFVARNIPVSGPVSVDLSGLTADIVSLSNTIVGQEMGFSALCTAVNASGCPQQVPLADSSIEMCDLLVDSSGNTIPATVSVTPPLPACPLGAAGTPTPTAITAPSAPTGAGSAQLGACTFVTPGAIAMASGEPYPSGVEANSNGYACIVALNNGSGQTVTSAPDVYRDRISFAPPMRIGGITYRDGVAVLVQTDSSATPDSGNTDTVIYQVGSTGTFTAEIGIDDVTMDSGANAFGSEQYQTSSQMEVTISVNGAVVDRLAFTSRGQSSPVSIPVQAGDQLAIAVSNLQRETLGSPSEPGQVDIVNPEVQDS
jgi:hypothetical protein